MSQPGAGYLGLNPGVVTTVLAAIQQFNHCTMRLLVERRVLEDDDQQHPGTRLSRCKKAKVLCTILHYRFISFETIFKSNSLTYITRSHDKQNLDVKHQAIILHRT